MLKQTIITASWVVAVCLVTVSGCQCAAPGGNAGDWVAADLERIKPSVKGSGARERVELALAMLKNNIVESRPVLICAVMTEIPGSGGGRLGIAVYDEDCDTIGVGIREERTVDDGQQTLLIEQYPISVHRPLEILDSRIVPVQLRDPGQHKNDQQWLEFVQNSKFDQKAARHPRYSSKTLPPMYISVPDPNCVDVFVYVYDRAGNKSDAITLFHNDSGTTTGRRD